VEGKKTEAQELGIKYRGLRVSDLGEKLLYHSAYVTKTVQRTDFVQGFSFLAFLFIFPSCFPRNRTWHLFLQTAWSYGYSPVSM